MSTVTHLDRHSEYYLEGGDLYIVVAHTIFRVHAYFFERESQRFRQIMSTVTAAGSAGKVRNGKSDNTAILIKGVSVDHFAKFLWIFYNQVYGVYTATLEEWVAILKFSHEYEFPEVKRLAIRELEHFDIEIAERIALYQEQSVDPIYIAPFYVKLCMRDEGPTDQEAARIGINMSIMIYRARERIRFRPVSVTRSASLAPDENITRIIHSLLGFDINGQTAVPRRLRRVALRRSSTELSTREPSSLSVTNQFVQNLVAVPKKEKRCCDTQEDTVFSTENCGYTAMEISQELIVAKGKVRTTEPQQVGFHLSLVDSTHGSAVAIFLVIPTRVFLLFLALSWTIFLFCLIRQFPSNLQIL